MADEDATRGQVIPSGYATSPATASHAANSTVPIIAS